MVVDARGRFVPVQEHVTATALAPVTSVIRKGIPTDWPRPPVPSHEDAGVDVRPPELEREAQIAPLRTEPFEKPTEVKRSWLSRHGTDLLIVTSGAFLVPAQRAGCHGLNWFSVTFASQAVICGIYHYCDQHRVGTDLHGPVCSDHGYRFWHLADHGMAYFVMLQMGFLLLGPEDPILRRFSPWASVERPPFASGNANDCHEPGDATGSEQGGVLGGQWQTVWATRLCPGFLMFLVIWRAARGEHVIGSPAFHVLLGTLCCLLFLFAQSAFWLLRPSVATHALQMKQSWFRALLCLCSVIIATMMFVAMQLVANDGTKVGMGGAKAFAHSAWHVGIASLATVVFEVIGLEAFRIDVESFQGHHFKQTVSGNMG